jgi:hypothetical protein
LSDLDGEFEYTYSNSTIPLFAVLPTAICKGVMPLLSLILTSDDTDDPNFADTDYQLAAYAAALRVLTKYKRIEEIDVSYELSRTKKPGEESKIEEVIEDAEPEQWNCLSDRAVLRFSKFPTISELYEIAWEIRRESEIRANSVRLWNDNA